jgi:hypothetical protein
MDEDMVEMLRNNPPDVVSECEEWKEQSENNDEI